MDLATCDWLLTTTRSVRKRLDLARPVEPAVVRRCLEIAMQAPTGSNMQQWHWLVVTDAAQRAALAAIYRRAFNGAFEEYIDNLGRSLPAGDRRAEQLPRVADSARYLAEHLHEVPVHVVPVVEGRVEHLGVVSQASTYGSILPAVWSFMLALRARGLGSAWTTLHLVWEQDAAAVLEIPDGFTQTALIPVAYYTGTEFKPARRLDADRFVHRDRW
jgi:nitroreductase